MTYHIQSLRAFLERQQEHNRQEQDLLRESLTLGQQIRETRTSSGVSQSAMASAVGISTPYLSQIENGVRVPSEATMTSIVYFFSTHPPKGETRGQDQD